MKKIFRLSLFYFVVFHLALMAQDVVGFWKTISDKTGKPDSIIGIYPYQGKYYGRIVATYNDEGKMDETLDHPKTRAPGVKGEPYYAGLDILWDLENAGSRYDHGKVMDPEKGKIYNAKMWTQDGNLIVRGEVLFFGENQTWPPALDQDFPPNFPKPDLTKFVPKIPEVKTKPVEIREAKKNKKVPV